MSASMRRTEELGGPFDMSCGPSNLFGSTSPIRNTRGSIPSSPYSHPSPTTSPGPSRHYAFPPSDSAPSKSSSPPRSAGDPLHRGSLGNMWPRRPSPLLHEIQPPSRRLSSHQMLLLTPFGGALPEGIMANDAGASGGLSMGRGSSSMGRGSSSMGRGSSSMGRSPLPFANVNPFQSASSAAAPTIPPPHPRSRHRSLGNQPSVSHHSQLASAPMATIPSASEHSGSSGAASAAPSREPSNHSEEDVEMEERVPSLIGGIPGTVPMTRSNSLPILTLRELDALKRKDGELGIARGGDWAWISTEESVEHMSPVSSSTRSHFPFTAFNDPFAQPAGPSQQTHPSSTRSSTSPTMSREHPSYPGSGHEPKSTLAGYHYSPTYNDSRRMSEAPSLSSMTSRGLGSPASTIGRRPSVPVTAFSRSSVMTTSSGSSNETSTSVGASPRASQLRTEDDGDRRSSLSPPQRPKITRYKSLPGRNEGLGLEIVVRPQDPSSGPNAGSPGESRRSSGGSRRGSSSQRRGLRKKGSWATVDVVDALSISELRLDTTSTSTSLLSSARQSIASASGTSASLQTASSSGTTSSSVSVPESIFLVEEVASRAHLADFAPDKGKEKTVYPNEELSGPYVPALAQKGWNATFPRRGSLAVLTKTPLAPWARNSDLSGLGMGDKDRVEGFGKHWSERRGSWAEGWGQT